MFLGHFATAYAAKRLAPRVSLGTLFAAAQLPDLVWPGLLLAGVAALLLLIYTVNVTSPPPPSVQAVAWAGAIGGVLFVALAAWVDRHREPREAADSVRNG